VVVGGSLGGLEALRSILVGLSRPFPGCMLVVLHTGPSSPGLLAKMVAPFTSLKAAYANGGEDVEEGAPIHRAGGLSYDGRSGRLGQTGRWTEGAARAAFSWWSAAFVVKPVCSLRALLNLRGLLSQLDSDWCMCPRRRFSLSSVCVIQNRLDGASICAFW
jgi:hypothetical protein